MNDAGERGPLDGLGRKPARCGWIDGVSVFFQVMGEGRTLVVLPGFGLDGAVMAAAFEPALAGAAGDGVRRVYIDLPGHGGSPPVGLTADDVLDAVAAALDDAAGPDPYLLAGHSYGGYLACALARRTPGRVAGLLLVTSGVRAAPESRDLAGVAPSDPEPGWDAALPEGLRGHFAQAVGRQTSGVAQRLAAAFAVRGPTDDDYLDRLRTHGYRLGDEDAPFHHPGPASVLAGRRDRLAGYRDSFGLLQSLPAATFTVLPDAGHYLPFERPEAFARVVGAWLAEAGGRTSSS